MLRARSILTSLLAGTLAGTCLAGCGGKNKSDGDFEPPPVVAANPSAPVVPPRSDEQSNGRDCLSSSSIWKIVGGPGRNPIR